MVKLISTTGVLCLLASACSAATPVEEDPSACRFTYESDSGRPPVQCSVPADSEETCMDAARCMCAEWNPEGTAEEIEECAEWETLPRGAITLADFCGPWASLSLAEALSTWAADRGALVVAEPECHDMAASIPGE